MHLKTYLNDGTGKPCAWHNRAKGWPDFFLKRDISESDEKVGGFDATGSIYEYKK